MIILLLNDVPSSLKGLILNYMTEISHNVFIGNYNSKIREQLWKAIKENLKGGNAVIIWNTTLSDVGYKYEVLGIPNRKIVDNYGIPIIVEIVKTRKARIIKSKNLIISNDKKCQ